MYNLKNNKTTESESNSYISTFMLIGALTLQFLVYGICIVGSVIYN